VEEYRRALQQDPLNVQFRYGLTLSLTAAGKPADAEAELRQILEIDQNFFPAYYFLSLLSGQRKGFAEALEYVEKGYSLAPMYAPCVGQFAGMAKHTGNVRRAEELLQKLRQGDEHWSAVGFFCFHLACGEPDQTADWCEKLVEQRNPAVGAMLRCVQTLYPSPRWAAVAKKMNLPE
jgi:tetratricopeptide (TPR) repeat protein